MKHQVWIAVASMTVLASLATPSFAFPDHAHYHYMVGVRAFTAQKHAAILYQEASKESLDFELARINADEMARASRELVTWVRRTEEIQSELEADLIRPEIEVLRELATSVSKSSEELRKWLDTSEGTSEELRVRVRTRCQELWHEYQGVLKQHKSAEAKLEIHPPPNPPRLIR